jgi:hypothetical protein
VIAELALRADAEKKVAAFIAVVFVLCIVYLVFLYRTEWERKCCGKVVRDCRCCPWCQRRDCPGKCWMPGAE